jgi:hypothetical protein
MRRRILGFIVLGLAVTACQKSETSTAPASSSGATATSAVAAVKDDRNVKVNTVIDPAVPLFLDQTAIGSRASADGTVTGEMTTFKVGEPVRLTMRFKQSPAGLQSSVRAVDERRKQVHSEWKEMKGANVVTFELPPLKPGQYKVTGYWGGNIACEYTVQIVGKK